ncbi:MAG: MFS transporter [Acidobacteria bacterium]|nr:MFS transporter [Acidobacteriota bacterium]
MAEAGKGSSGSPLTALQWVICFVASLGFFFDSYQLLMMPLVLPPALAELGKLQPGTPAYSDWVSLLFYIPAVCGGIFGLLGGYLTDLFGRRRVLVWSILLYAFSAFAAGYSTSLEMLLVMRCLTWIGVCVEFVAGIAWLAEIFPDARQREKVLGYTQAVSSLGGVAAGAVNVWLGHNGSQLFSIYGAHEAWRYTLVSGVIPAIPLILIRPFLPESTTWAQKKKAGTLRRPRISELFAPDLLRTTIVTTLMMACCYGVAYGSIQQTPQIVRGLSEISSLARPLQGPAVGVIQVYQEMGGLVGRVLLAILAVYIVHRGRLVRLFIAPGLLIVPYVFLGPAVQSVFLIKWGIFVTGILTVSQFSFWGNYLPRVFPTHLRGTGESFAANVGGRLVGTFGAVAAQQLSRLMPGSSPFVKLAYAASTVALICFATALVSSFWLPEPKHDELPD